MTVDKEISFNYPAEDQVNNNATLVEHESETQDPNQSLEDGECGQSIHSGCGDIAGDTTEASVERVVERKIEELMTKVQDYFDCKFRDMSKIMELEKQLEENKNTLSNSKLKVRATQVGANLMKMHNMRVLWRKSEVEVCLQKMK